MTAPHEANGRIKLSWQQIAWGITMALSLGAAWMDLRIQVTKSDERSTRIEGKLDRVQRDVDQLQQVSTFKTADIETRLRALEIRRH